MSKSQKYLLIPLLSFLVTLALIFSNMQPSTQTHRNWLDHITINSICNKASPKLEEIYKNGETIEYKPHTSNTYQPIIEYLSNKDSSNIKDYIPRVFPFLRGFFTVSVCSTLVDAVIKKTIQIAVEEFPSFLSLIFLGSVIIGSVVGFIVTPQLLEGVNGTTCSFFKLYITAIEGEQKEEIPKWNGINKIKELLTDTILSVDTINSNANNFQATNPEVFTSDYRKLIIEKFSNVDELKSPASNDETAFAEYAKKYVGNKDSEVYIQYTEDYNSNLLIGALIAYNLKFSTDILVENTKDIKEKLNYAVETIESIDDTFTTLSDEVLSKWGQYQNTFNDYSNLVIFAVFGSIIFFSLVGWINVFCYVTCPKFQLLRFAIHLVWNFMSWFMIVTFILGSVIGLLGVVGTDIVGVLSYTFSVDNLLANSPIILSEGYSNIYWNTCLNGDGDLSNAFNFTEVKGNILNDIYSKRAEIDKEINKINNIVFPSALITKNNDELNKAKSSIDSVVPQFELSNYWDKVKTEDMYWTIYEDSCPDEYENGYSSSSEKEGSGKYCYAIATYWTNGKDLSNFCQSDTICNEVIPKVISFLSYFDSVMKQTSVLLENNNEINLKYEQDKNQIASSWKDSVIVINPWTDIFSKVVGNDTIFSIINCNFMKSNLHILYEQLDDKMGKSAIMLSAVLLSISFCEVFAVLFTWIVVLRYRESDQKPSNRKEDKSSVRDLKNDCQVIIGNQNEAMQEVELQ